MSYRPAIALLSALLLQAPLHAGLYDSGIKWAPLPAQPRGYLIDQRALRMLAVPRRLDAPRSLLQESQENRLTQFAQLAKQRALSADELADYGALLIRFGKLESAVEVLQPAIETHPKHFRLHSNLATASQLRGDLERASTLLTTAITLAPDEWRSLERYHLRLVRLRLREQGQSGRDDTLDDLFNQPLDSKDLPPDAIAIVQQLGLWLPGDARLLWLFAELLARQGDYRTAAAILEGCMSELGLASPAVREQRRKWLTAIERIEAVGEHVVSRFIAKSPRPLLSRFDPSLLPTIQADAVNPLPWVVLDETLIDRGFRPTFPSYLSKLEGKRVRLSGFMQPLGDGPDLSAFLLIEFPIGCWYCESPDRSGIVQVELPQGMTTPFKRQFIVVEGLLQLNRTDPEQYLFRLTGAKVADPS